MLQTFDLCFACESQQHFTRIFEDGHAEEVVVTDNRASYWYLLTVSRGSFVHVRVDTLPAELGMISIPIVNPANTASCLCCNGGITESIDCTFNH